MVKKCLTWRTKKSIVDEASISKNIKGTAIKRKVSPHQIRRWGKALQDVQQALQAKHQGDEKKFKREFNKFLNKKTTNKGPKRKDREHDDVLLTFVQDARAKGLPVRTKHVVQKLNTLKGEDYVEESPRAVQKRVFNWLKSKGYVMRAATHVAQKQESDPEVMRNFQNGVNNKIAQENLNPDNVVNMDETNFHFDCPSTLTLDQKGVKDVTVTKSGSNARCTVILAVTLSGGKLDPFVIFKAKPGGRVEKEFKEGYPIGTHFVVQEKAWNDEEKMHQWIDMVWMPFANRNNGKKLLMMDTVNTHEVKGCTEKIESLNTILEWIPGGYTWKLQPLDVGVNKPFKDHMRQEYDDFMWDQYDTPDAERKKVERINVGFWVNKVWYDDEKITKETIQKSFKRCGIKAPALRA